MELVVQPLLREKILLQYEKNMALYPQKRREVEAFLQGREETFCLCLRYLYGHLPANDMLSFSVPLLASYASASLEAYETIDYVKTIPQEVFFSYVLWHRVNSECLDDSRYTLMSQLLPLVQGKTMEDAALAVNLWCCAHATYTPADDRTLGPLSVLRRTLGRCGEESVLAVAALRSVGIPARQCYCPRWSHCDDNHAWVEVWVDGNWHYLGACEPEPVLDRGWFTAAASRAMLVHSKCWSDFDIGETTLQATPLYREVSCTARYADLRTLNVRITEYGAPLENVAVAFQIVNYSEFFTLHRDCTDSDGMVCFDTGLGDLCVFVVHQGRMLLQKVDMRTQKGVLELDLRGADELPDRITMDLVPPIGRSDVQPLIENPIHAEKLQACEEQRAKIAATFHKVQGKGIREMALQEAAGNWPEIQKFLLSDRYPLEQNEEILETLRQKDFVDITAETLLDALDAANPVRERYPAQVFQSYILAPRIGNEMLLPERKKIRDLFLEGFDDPQQILAWMQQNVQLLDADGADNYEPSAYGCLYHRQVPVRSFDAVFVALCRAFRFPARLDPVTGEGQWLDAEQAWHSIHPGEVPTVTLTMINPTSAQLNYGEHISVACWNGTDFVTLCYPGLTIAESYALQVKPGRYRIVTTTRQIDGTASVALRHIRLDADMKIVLDIPKDQTAQRLQQVRLDLPEGPARAALSEMTGQVGILIFADPGGEPTEHLLQEMLECTDAYYTTPCHIRIFVQEAAAMENATLRRAMDALPQMQVQVCRDPEGEAALHTLLGQGDLRLPFVVAVDAAGRGVYASANYNIRMAQTLLRILNLIQ